MIDKDLPLFSSDGYQHALVAASSHQIVTKFAGVFGLWDKKTGQCLNAGHEDLTLSNQAPCPVETARQKSMGTMLLADLHANAAVAKAAALGGLDARQTPAEYLDDSLDTDSAPPAP